MILASNTSSIPIATLARWTHRPTRVLGLHFFSPVPVMKLVEIVVALDTADETIVKGEAFVEQIGKRPIRTKDRSGFIVNMLLVPYLMAAVRMYEDGFATREDIDDGMKLGAGHPMGPLHAVRLHRPRRPLRGVRLAVRGVQARGVRAAAADEADGRARAPRPEDRPRVLRVRRQRPLSAGRAARLTPRRGGGRPARRRRRTPRSTRRGQHRGQERQSVVAARADAGRRARERVVVSPSSASVRAARRSSSTR